MCLYNVRQMCETDLIFYQSNPGFEQALTAPAIALRFGSILSFGPTNCKALSLSATAVAAPRPYSSAVALVTIHFDVPMAASSAWPGGKYR